MAPELGVEAPADSLIILALVSYLDRHMAGILRAGAFPLGPSCERLQVALALALLQTLPPVALP